MFQYKKLAITFPEIPYRSTVFHCAKKKSIMEARPALFQCENLIRSFPKIRFFGETGQKIKKIPEFCRFYKKLVPCDNCSFSSLAVEPSHLTKKTGLGPEPGP